MKALEPRGVSDRALTQMLRSAIPPIETARPRRSMAILPRALERAVVRRARKAVRLRSVRA